MRENTTHGFGRNILLTGIPRSGTTLCCSFLNDLENTLALVEPMPVSEISKAASNDEASKNIIYKISEFRSKAESGTALSKLSSNKIASNIIQPKSKGKQLRSATAQLGALELESPLPETGTLIVKHNAMFAALLANLQEQIEVYALIRNPLPVLASWAQVDLPVNRGHIPAGEVFDCELKCRLESEPDIFSRQLIIMDWFFFQYAQLDPGKILRYENLVSGQHLELKKVMGLDAELTSAANSNVKNQNQNYDKAVLISIADRLLESDGAYWDFYPKESIAALLE